jgi:DNA-binding MarR family transcriptional regulator
MAAQHNDIESKRHKNLDNALLFRIFQTTNLMHKTGTKWVANSGVTTQQWSILGALSLTRAKKGIPIGQFSELLLLSRQTLNGILGRLEDLGLTTRIADEPDARIKKVVFTDKGRDVWTGLNEEIRSYCKLALSSFTEKEKGDFLHLVEKLQANLIEIDGKQALGDSSPEAHTGRSGAASKSVRD